jgi:multiple sugar transport system substrate-binding protein
MSRIVAGLGGGLSAGALATVLFSGAGCTANHDEGPPTVSFLGWGGPEEKEIVTSVLGGFARTEPGFTIAYNQIPGVGYDYVNKIRLMIVADIAPDVFYVPDGAFGELVSRGSLLDIDGYVEKSNVIRLDEMWATGIDRYRWDGSSLHRGALYCLPKDIGPTAIFYNADLLRQRGVPLPDPTVPMTWDEALETWKKLSYQDGSSRHYGISGFPYEPAAWSAGASILSDDKRSWVLDSDAGIEAVQWCADLALVHGVAPAMSTAGGGMGTRELFEAGLAAMHFDGRWMVPRFRKLGFAWDVAPVPVRTRGSPSISWSGSVGLCINPKSRHPAEAFRLIEYLAGPEGQTALTRTGFQVPNQKALARTEVFLQPGLAPAHPEVFLIAAETSRPGPWTDTPNAFWQDVFGTFIGKVWRGERTARSLLVELAPIVNQALRENNPQPKGAP